MKILAAALTLGLSLLLNLSACSLARDESVTEPAIGDGVESTEVVEQESQTQPAGPQVVSPTEGNVRIIGRTCEVDGVTWLAQSGSAVEFTVEGTKVELQLAGGDAVESAADLRPRFAVLLDGEVVLDDTLSERSRTVEVFSGDTARQATVEVIQLSEAKRGVVGVESISVESDSPTPVAPTPRKDLSIEFIGDSITCAFGVESNSFDVAFKTTTENFMKSYAYLTAQALGADYSTVCYSGYGVVSGWSVGGSRNEEMLLPPLYGVVAEYFGQPWDFSTHSHDVVVINLGTNDFSYTGADEGRSEEFANAYVDFLTQVRELNPNSYIICTFGTMGGRELYPYLEQAVERFTGLTGDTRITCYLSDEIDWENDGCGTNGHPNAITQQKSADKLVEVIRGVL